MLRKKATADETCRTSKKVKFKGNQFTAETDTDFVSTSAKKLKTASYEDIQVDQNIGYVICNFFTIFSILSDILVCKSCGGDVKFDRTTGAGISFKLIVTCNCKTQYCSSSPCVNQSYEINRRFMFAMRMLGVGLQSLRTFCGIMDITCSFSNNIYYSFLAMLDTAAQSVFKIVQRKAVDEEISLNAEHGNEARQLSVSGDGSWKKRGFSSLFGISTLVGKYCGKVLDFVVKSAYCQSCANWALRKGAVEYDQWQNTHGDNCTANHQGSAGKMEVREMFARSEKSLGVKYSNYIDTKTFKAILDLDLYDDITVQKKECVGYVQKRMRCLGGNTENCNESFNACVWRLAPKHLHSSTQTINSVTAISASFFNEGTSSLLTILNALGIAVGLGAVQFARTFDERRLQAAEKKVCEYARMAYLDKKNKAIAQQERFELEEGILYSPGIED